MTPFRSNKAKIPQQRPTPGLPLGVLTTGGRKLVFFLPFFIFGGWDQGQAEAEISAEGQAKRSYVGSLLYPGPSRRHEPSQLAGIQPEKPPLKQLEWGHP